MPNLGRIFCSALTFCACFSCTLGSLKSICTRGWAIWGSIPGDKRFFLLKKKKKNLTGSGDHPASCSTHTKGPFPVVKQLGCEVDNSPLSSAALKTEWNYIT